MKQVGKYKRAFTQKTQVIYPAEKKNYLKKKPTNNAYVFNVQNYCYYYILKPYPMKEYQLQLFQA